MGDRRTEHERNKTIRRSSRQRIFNVNSLFKRRFKGKWTLCSPNKIRRQYDHIFVNERQKTFVTKFKVLRKFDHDSYHCPVTMIMNLGIKKTKKETLTSTLTKRLREKKLGEKIDIELRNRFGCLKIKI